ncbi:MAG: GNAT family N-acetyltransferase [Fimbriimonas sp.]|nr:GNAT family N-acetyltransferase [Fimbriimonas sp.]
MIRPAERKDVLRIWSLIGELADYERLAEFVTGNAEALERHIFDDRYCTVFVCEVEGEVVGYTLSFPIYSTFRTLPCVWLEDIYVTPSFRGRGFGKALLTNLIEYCRAHGFGRLDWSVLSWNEPSIQFYQSMGAEVMPDWRICRIAF